MAPAPPLPELIASVHLDAEGVTDPLQLLSVASRTAAQLAETSDDLLNHFVDECRRADRSWADISVALGVSKQAAHKRFALPAPNFDRFTDRARLSLAAAPEAAKALGHTFVGTEHLLLGLFEPEGTVAERILTTAGLTRAAVEATVLSHTPQGSGASTEPPYTPRAADALGGALSEALELGHNYIGTEHLLLGLLRNEGGLAARILSERGLPHDVARAKVVELLAGFRKR